jgi:hypothetical protein
MPLLCLEGCKPLSFAATSGLGFDSSLAAPLPPCAQLTANIAAAKKAVFFMCSCLSIGVSGVTARLF